MKKKYVEIDGSFYYFGYYEHFFLDEEKFENSEEQIKNFEINSEILNEEDGIEAQA